MIHHRILIVTALACMAAGCVARPAPIQGRSPVSAAPRTRPEAPALVRKKNGHYRVTKPWTVRLNGTEWHVQKGYTSNGITAPADVKRVLGDGVNEPETWAAVFHDWLFTQPGMTRGRADKIFLQILDAYGVPLFKARLMYSGVSAYSTGKTLR